MSEFGYRVRILDCLLDGQQSFEMKLDEESSSYQTIFVERQASSYTVDFLLVDSSDHFEKVKVFFEVLRNGKLLSGAKTQNTSESIDDLPDLTDHGLDEVLNQALMFLAH